MLQIVKYFVNLVTFRAKPQDVPESDQLVVATALLALVTSLPTASIGETFGATLAISTLQILIFAAVIWLVLRYNGVSERWRQTITALFGALTIMQLFGWIVSPGTDQTTQPIATSTLPAPLVMVVAAWYLAVMTHILRHAIESSIVKSFLIGCAVQLLTVVVLVLIITKIGLVPDSL
ncbi:MAG: hypothetical protein OEQ39_10465 [Gammaproteobacteria bacterium]|nr:hypothetical protein [Gammaproteobacteria bacterium]MDH3468698.1 hypothetical protein [Gammaproteobacteria bacterium]